MRLLVVGAGGFIGQHMVHAAIARGHTVYAVGRRKPATLHGAEWLDWSMGEPLPDAICRATDAAVHLAHDFHGEEGAARTIASTAQMCQQLSDAGVKRQIFFSSYSAGPHARSRYGRTKTLLEHRLGETPGMTIVRPGLVLGDGGIYRRLARVAKRVPILPLPDGGRGEVPVVEVEALCEQVLDIAGADSMPKEVNLYQPRFRTLKEIVCQAAAEVGRRPMIVPIPTGLIMLVLRLADAVHLPLPVNADNLAGFIANQTARRENVSALDDR